MSRGRGTAIAAALLLAALAVAGCGLGPGKEVGNVELTVTREFGAVPMVSDSVVAKESDTVMRVLEGSAAIETRYGGGFVKSIEGVAEAQQGGDSYDWFFFVNGVESPVGAASYPLAGEESIWWDYRNWAATDHVPAVVGSWPEPFVDGYEGESHPVEVACEGGGDACETVAAALEAEGVKLSEGEPDGVIRVLVGPWAKVGEDAAAAQIEAGPGVSGVYAGWDGGRLQGLDSHGDPAKTFGPDAGLVAATRQAESPPVWVVTGATQAGVRAAAGALGETDLRDHYAVAVEAGKAVALPVAEP